MAGDYQPTGKRLGDAEAMTKECLLLEARLAELHVAYEQFFLGVEKRPPAKQHEAFKKALEQLKLQVVRQVAARFRVQTLAQKFLTYERLWERTIKEIEAGVHRRDRARLKKIAAPVKKASKPEAEPDFDIDDIDVDEDVPAAPAAGDSMAAALAAATGAPPPPVGAKPAVKAPPPKAGLPAAPPPPPKAAVAAKAPGRPGSEDGLSEQKIRAIYDAYVTAKKRCGEDTSALSLSSVADTLRKQVPALMKQHNAKSVDFKVVIKDGKAVLRALPRE